MLCFVKQLNLNYFLGNNRMRKHNQEKLLKEDHLSKQKNRSAANPAADLFTFRVKSRVRMDKESSKTLPSPSSSTAFDNPDATNL